MVSASANATTCIKHQKATRLKVWKATRLKVWTVFWLVNLTSLRLRLSRAWAKTLCIYLHARFYYDYAYVTLWLCICLCHMPLYTSIEAVRVKSQRIMKNKLKRPDLLWQVQREHSPSVREAFFEVVSRSSSSSDSWEINGCCRACRRLYYHVLSLCPEVYRFRYEAANDPQHDGVESRFFITHNFSQLVAFVGCSADNSVLA